MSASINDVLARLDSILLGKDQAVRMAFCCLLARGHLLIEDIPGVGKTTLAHALAKVFGLDFRRVQFTSDLLPADVLGNSIFDPASRQFVFHPGPIFAQMLLADEVNRATPKAQSALLEAMEEGQVTIDGNTHMLPVPFFVIATQNPQRQIGTYPLPESQLDRFLMRLELGFPGRRAEKEMLAGQDRRDLIRHLQPMVSPEQLIAWQERCARCTSPTRCAITSSTCWRRAGRSTAPRRAFPRARAWPCNAARRRGPSPRGAKWWCRRMCRPSRPTSSRTGWARRRRGRGFRLVADGEDHPRRAGAMKPESDSPAAHRRSGLFSGPVLGCMWMAAVNYSNNLVYAILYLIGVAQLHLDFSYLAQSRVAARGAYPHPAGLRGRGSARGNPSAQLRQKTIYGFFFARLGEDAGLTRRRRLPLRHHRRTAGCGSSRRTPARRK